MPDLADRPSGVTHDKYERLIGTAQTQNTTKSRSPSLRLCLVGMVVDGARLRGRAEALMKGSLHTDAAGIVLGTRVPVILTSCAD